MTKCPECDADVQTAAMVEGQIVVCPDCAVELEVISLDPPELALAPEIEEDWGK